MPRIARAVAVGVPHHVTQRGNHRQDVFFSPEDHQVYLQWLAEYAAKYNVSIWAYCLMLNHIHLVVTPNSPNALAHTMQAVQSRFTQRQNNQFHWEGHLWQGRFFSAPLDDSYFWHAIRYVERNPCRAKLVDRAEDYRWSSAAAHCGLVTDQILSPIIGEPAMTEVEWSDWLAGDEGDEIRLLRAATDSGNACGGPDFIARLSSIIGRPLQVKPRGRPKKLISQIVEDIG